VAAHAVGPCLSPLRGWQSSRGLAPGLAPWATVFRPSGPVPIPGSVLWDDLLRRRGLRGLRVIDLLLVEPVVKLKFLLAAIRVAGASVGLR